MSLTLVAFCALAIARAPALSSGSCASSVTASLRADAVTVSGAPIREAVSDPTTSAGSAMHCAAKA
jgi:hypothetical protein